MRLHSGTSTMHLARGTSRFYTRPMSTDRDRVISISLTEAEWQAFIARQPKPVDWIRARILDELQANAAVPERTAKDSRAIYH
jgi:hypothetical protein